MRSTNHYHDEDDDLSSPIPMEDIERIQRFTEQEMSRCDTILQSESSTESEREHAQKEKQLYLEDIEAINIERMESNDASDSVWIPSANLWTTLALTSCDYLRRFRWRSGLSIAITLYLIATFAFSWMSVDDEEATFDDGIQSMVSRQLLSGAAGDAVTITVLILRTFMDSEPAPPLIVVNHDDSQPPSFINDHHQCIDLINEVLRSNVAYSVPPTTSPISTSYWKDVSNGENIRICQLLAGLEIRVSGFYDMVPLHAVFESHGVDRVGKRALSAMTGMLLPVDASPALEVMSPAHVSPPQQQSPPQQPFSQQQVFRPPPAMPAADLTVPITFLVMRTSKRDKFVLAQRQYPNAMANWAIPDDLTGGAFACKQRFTTFVANHAATDGMTFQFVGDTNAQNVHSWTEQDAHGRTNRICLIDANVQWTSGSTKFNAFGVSQLPADLSNQEQRILQRAALIPRAKGSPLTASQMSSRKPTWTPAAPSHVAPPDTIPSVPVPSGDVDDQDEWDTTTKVVLTISVIGILAILCCAFIVIIGIMSNSQSEATEAVEQEPEDLDQAEEKRDGEVHV